MSETATHGARSANLEWVLRVPFDPMTYRSLMYLLLAIPLALLYLPMLITGVSLSIGLTIVLIGPFVLVATLLVVIGFGWIEAALADVLLDADVDPSFPTSESVTGFARELLLGKATWLSMLFLVWKIFVGFAALIGLVVAWSISLSFLLAPLVYAEHVVVRTWWGAQAIDTPEMAALVFLTGVVIVFLTLVSTNVFGRVSRAVAEHLLATGE